MTAVAATAAALWAAGCALSVIIAVVTVRRSAYRSNAREPEVSPVSWALVVWHIVSLIGFLSGLFLAWWSGDAVLHPVLPYAVAMAAVCLGVQLVLMLVQARRASRTLMNARLARHI